MSPQLPLSKRVIGRTGWLIVAAWLLVAAGCGSGDDAGNTFGDPLSNTVDVHEDGDAGEGHDHLVPEDLTATLSVTLVSSELVLGPTRFAVGIFDGEGSLILDATVHFHYYDLTDSENAVLESEADAERLVAPDGLTTIYAHEREFSRAGDWGLEVEARLAEGGAAFQSIGFRVADDTPSLGPGEAAPALDTLTLADVDQDVSRLTSSESPNLELHRSGLAEALANDDPTVLLFATPAFCTTRFCGPVYDMLSELQPLYADRLNFVYVEAFSNLPDPALSGLEPSPAMIEFGLESEPWLFFIDPDGTIVYRVEGFWTSAEIVQQLELRLGL